MKRVLKYLLYFACLIVGVVGVAVAYVFYASNQRVATTYAVTPPAVAVPLGDAAAIERGRYLVHKVSLCIECHGEDLGGKAVEHDTRSPVSGEATSPRGAAAWAPPIPMRTSCVRSRTA